MTTYKKIMNIALPAMAENFLQLLQRMQKLLLTYASRSIMKCSRKIL